MFAFWETIRERPGIEKVLILFRVVVDSGPIKMISDFNGKEEKLRIEHL